MRGLSLTRRQPRGLGVENRSSQRRRCPRCKSTRLRKDGRDRKGNQMYECAKCSKKVSERHYSVFRGLRTNGEIVELALTLYLRGLSLRQVAQTFEDLDVKVSHVSVWNWIIRFGQQCRSRLYRSRGDYDDTWYIDEMHVKCNGRKHYVWSARDAKRRPIAMWGCRRRDTNAAVHLLKKAVRITGRIPETIITDRWKAYPPAIRKVCPGVRHRKGHIKWNQTNNMMEGFFGSFLRPRFRNLRNFKLPKFANALLDLLHTWYLWDRPHIGCNGSPPGLAV